MKVGEKTGDSGGGARPNCNMYCTRLATRTLRSTHRIHHLHGYYVSKRPLWYSLSPLHPAASTLLSANRDPHVRSFSLLQQTAIHATKPAACVRSTRVPE